MAAEQDSLITWAQLRELGLERGAIEHRVRRGLLHRVHVGVFGWGIAAASPWARARAALLACGRGAFASGHAAIGLYGFAPHPQGPIDVTVVGRRVRHTGIRVHAAAAVHSDDVRSLRGIWVSSPARALLEVAAELPDDALATAVEQAQIKRMLSKREMRAVLARAGRRPGVQALRALVDEPAFTRSKAERIVVSLVRCARLPEPLFNGVAEGFEVDALWRRERVVLEFDSYTFHATRAAFERDRRKSAALTRGRYLVLRTTWRELTQQSHALVARLSEALALSQAPHDSQVVPTRDARRAGPEARARLRRRAGSDRPIT